MLEELDTQKICPFFLELWYEPLQKKNANSDLHRLPH